MSLERTELTPTEPQRSFAIRAGRDFFKFLKNPPGYIYEIYQDYFNLPGPSDEEIVAEDRSLADEELKKGQEGELSISERILLSRLSDPNYRQNPFL